MVACRVLVAGVIMISMIALPCGLSFAQGMTELAFILSSNPIQDTSSSRRAHSDLFADSGVKTLFVGAIRFYQLFISPQDTPVCNFVPSCSQFGVESIKRLGVIYGVLLTSDRLQRCNSMSNARYQIDHKSGLLADPLQIYCEILHEERGE